MQLIPWDEKLKTDFADIVPELTQEEKRADQDWKLQKNLISIVDIYRADNPDLDEDEAKTEIEQNKLDNSALGKVSRLGLLTQQIGEVND